MIRTRQGPSKQQSLCSVSLLKDGGVQPLPKGPQSAHSQDAGLKEHFKIIFFLVEKKYHFTV